jgi:hypothetical protein
MPPVNTSSTLQNTSPYKRRFAWWTNGWFISLVLVEAAVGTVLGVMIMAQSNTGTGIFFGFGWLLLCYLAGRMFKEALDELYHHIDESIVNKTERELTKFRTKVQEDFYNLELRSLQRGKRTSVLEEWRTGDPKDSPHQYFHAIRESEIDPAARTFFLRIHLGTMMLLPKEERQKFQRFIWNELIHFIACIGSDKRVLQLGAFFDDVIIELLATPEDHVGKESYPFLSIRMPKEKMFQFNTDELVIVTDLRKLGDVRFEGGLEIEPHHEQPTS